ncbi:MAG: hypothetical protein SFX19_10155 [Alphaproteobacteria bacterium]|nr:hypothetical protein [Alphaproteobacteria bacterium]
MFHYLDIFECCLHVLNPLQSQKFNYSLIIQADHESIAEAAERDLPLGLYSVEKQNGFPVFRPYLERPCLV